MTKLLTHKMHSHTYALQCGTIHGKNPVFELGHGASIYWQDVDCPDCKKAGGMDCEDEGCPHYGTPHSHKEDS